MRRSSHRALALYILTGRGDDAEEGEDGSLEMHYRIGCLGGKVVLVCMKSATDLLCSTLQGRARAEEEQRHDEELAGSAAAKKKK